MKLEFVAGWEQDDRGSNVQGTYDPEGETIVVKSKDDDMKKFRSSKVNDVESLAGELNDHVKKYCLNEPTEDYTLYIQFKKPQSESL